MAEVQRAADLIISNIVWPNFWCGSTRYTSQPAPNRSRSIQRGG